MLSLQHLAAGVMAITGCSRLEALLLAVGIDLGLVVTECAAIVASPAAARSIRFYVWAMITSTLALSAGLNSWAFAQHSEGLKVYASCAFGFFIPLMVFGLSKVAALPQLKLAWALLDGPTSWIDAVLGRAEILSDAFLSTATPVQLALPALLQASRPMQARIRASGVRACLAAE